MSETGPVPKRCRFAILIAAVLYVAGVASYTIWTAHQVERDSIKAVDDRLVMAAKSLKRMSAPDFHDRAIDEQPIGSDEIRRNRIAVSDFVSESSLKSACTFVERGGQLHFAAFTASNEELDQGDSRYFYPCEDVPDGLAWALRGRVPVFATYRDHGGTFRSVAVPEVSPGGRPYLACASCEIGYLQGVKHERYMESGVAALGFLVLCLPIILSLRGTYSACNAQLSAANRQLREVQESLESQVQQRTSELAQTNSDLQQEIAERRRTESALRESESNLQAMFDVAPVGMILLDENLIIRKANKHAAYITGRGVDEIVGKPVGTGIGCPHAADAPELCGQIQPCSACPCRGSLQKICAVRRSR